MFRLSTKHALRTSFETRCFAIIPIITSLSLCPENRTGDNRNRSEKHAVSFTWFGLFVAASFEAAHTRRLAHQNSVRRFVRENVNEAVLEGDDDDGGGVFRCASCSHCTIVTYGLCRWLLLYEKSTTVWTPNLNSQCSQSTLSFRVRPNFTKGTHSYFSIFFRIHSDRPIVSIIHCWIG